jgi:ribosomal-protein-serine acetyltransferase
MGETDAMRLDVTEELHLRLLEDADAEELYGLIEVNRAYLAEWLPWAGGQTLDGVAEFIRKTRKQLDDNDGLQGALVLDGRIVGAGGLLGIDWESRKTGIGYWLAEEHQGRGFMTRTVQAVADYAFDDLGLNRVEIQVGTDNAKSRAIPERLGFRQEGVLRDYERVGDRYLDIVVYSLLASERQRRAP